MRQTGISSRYTAPGLNANDLQSIDELLAFPGHDWKAGVTLAAGTPVIAAGDILTMITTGPDTGKFRKQLTGEPAVCIAARPVQPTQYDTANPVANVMLDTDFMIDTIYSGYVKASMVHGDLTGMDVIDLRPAQDVLIVR